MLLSPFTERHDPMRTIMEMRSLEDGAHLDELTLSCGYANDIPNQKTPPHDLQALADQALYRAKQSGRNAFSN